MVQIAVIGDVHTYFDEADVAYFNASAYDLILFVGDLANWRHSEGLAAAGVMATLRKPAIFMPGNHDAILPIQLMAEVRDQGWLAATAGTGHRKRAAELDEQMGQVVYAGYSNHPFQVNGLDFDVLATRPYAMGGSRLSYKPHMQSSFGVASMADSIALLHECVDQTKSDNLIILSHNGPTGLGERRDDIWGCDFKPEEGDFGDEDVTAVIEYARQQGKRILALFAGHMHHKVKGGGQRVWCVERDGTSYINAARVPRIFTEDGERKHHHVRMTWDGSEVKIEQMLVSL